MTLALMFVALGVLLVLEVPVAFALIFSAVGFLLLDGTFPLNIVIQRMASGLDSFPLLAIPLLFLLGICLIVRGLPRGFLILRWLWWAYSRQSRPCQCGGEHYFCGYVWGGTSGCGRTWHG